MLRIKTLYIAIYRYFVDTILIVNITVSGYYGLDAIHQKIQKILGIEKKPGKKSVQVSGCPSVQVALVEERYFLLFGFSSVDEALM